MPSQTGLVEQEKTPSSVALTDHPPSPFLLAQETHFFSATTVVFAWVALHLIGGANLGAFVIVLIAFIKEMTYDREIEGQPWWFSKGWKNSGFVDNLFYWLGAGVAIVVVSL